MKKLVEKGNNKEKGVQCSVRIVGEKRGEDFALLNLLSFACLRSCFDFGIEFQYLFWLNCDWTVARAAPAAASLTIWFPKKPDWNSWRALSIVIRFVSVPLR